MIVIYIIAAVAVAALLDQYVYGRRHRGPQS